MIHDERQTPLPFMASQNPPWTPSNAYELLSAYDKLVNLGYRKNLTISQIKTFLEMESHEERIQEISARVCCLYPGIAGVCEC